jgi:hypothetical protein
MILPVIFILLKESSRRAAIKGLPAQLRPAANLSNF